jgi:hypothetical protein
MANKNLTIDLHPRPDGDERTFYVGKLEFPGTIDCSEGVTFIIFVSDAGSEQLQICKMDNNSKKGYKGT